MNVCNEYVCECACVRAHLSDFLQTPLYSASKALQELPLLVTGLGQIKAMPLHLAPFSLCPRQATAFLSTFESHLLDLELVSVSSLHLLLAYVKEFEETDSEI